MNTNFARTAMRIVTVWGATAMIAAPLAVPVSSLAASTSAVTTFQALAGTDLLALGPVERVDVSKRQIQVLGQVVVVPAAQSAGLADLVDHMVEVHGSVNSDGTLRATKVVEINSSSFVPGATQLYLKGAISSVDQVNAVARIGSLSIKYAGALHTLSSSSLAVGQLASFGGVEYSGIAAFYAEAGRVIGSLVPLSQEGTDKVSPLSQEGTDKVKPLSQEGTDKVKPLSQEGTDKVSPLSQEGTDKVSPLSQEGTDKVKPLSQEGTDKVKPLSQEGTDKVKPLSQEGTDKVSPLSQEGTDKVSPLSQEGTDKVSPLSQEGTDKVSPLSQ
ncbi:MAG: hypothetical protein ABSG30_07775 [Steroidobacteraceae bacterium]